jgi:hypothetical protein
VFQAYLTTFLIEPGYEKPIKTVELMLKNEKKFGLLELDRIILFPNTSETVNSAIAEDAVQCPDELTCFIWAAVYHNISTVITDMELEIYRAAGYWADENNRPLLCKLEDGVMRTIDFLMSILKGTPIFEPIDDVIGHIFEGGIFLHMKERSFDKLRRESMLDVPTSADTYYAICMGHLQTAFYLLILGYVMAIVYFVSEIMWHSYWSKI